MTHDANTITEPKTEVKVPRLYQVVIHNDDYTPIDFVIEVLKQIFNKDGTEATAMAHDVHNKGKAVVGIYTLDIAETKVQLAMTNARMHQHPLKLEIQPT